MRLGERGVQRIALEPARIRGAEAREPLADRGRDPRRTPPRPARASRRTRGDDSRRRRGTSARSIDASSTRPRSECDRDVADVAREDRAVVRRRIVARGLALRPELDPGEPEWRAYANSRSAALVAGEPRPTSSSGSDGKLDVVDREQQALLAEAREPIAGCVGSGAHSRPSAPIAGMNSVPAMFAWGLNTCSTPTSPTSARCGVRSYWIRPRRARRCAHRSTRTAAHPQRASDAASRSAARSARRCMPPPTARGLRPPRPAGRSRAASSRRPRPRHPCT